MAKVMNFLQSNLGLPGPPPQIAQRADAQSSRRVQAEGAKALPTGQSVEEMMTCKICQKIYSPDADGKRLPRDLGCSHVFCQRCLSDCVSRTGSKSFIACPLCKKKTTLVGNSVLELPVNRQLLSLVRSNQHKQHRPHHHHHSHSQPSEGKQVRLEDRRVEDHEERRNRHGVRDEYQDQRKSRSSSEDRHGKNCSCSKHAKVVPQKQIVVKSAMKKLRITDEAKDKEDHTAVVVAPSRLHPPPKGSAFAPTRVPGEDGSSIGSCTDLESPASVAESGRELSACVEEEIEVISNEAAPIVRSKYPLEELHEMAPKSLVEDLNEANGYTDDATTAVDHMTDVDHVTSLNEMLHQQPTSAAYSSSFGRYSEVRAYPGDFCGPVKVSCSKENKVLVVDKDLEGVQAFSTTGDCLANFSVPEVTGACFLDEATLAVSSPRGVELYRLSGRLLLTIPIGPTVAVARYTDGGFVAAQPTKVSIGRNPTTTVRLHTITSVRQAGRTSKRSFIDITDVAASRSGLIAVLDDQAILVIDQDGNLEALIDPSNLLPGSPPAARIPEAALNQFKPYSVAFDPLSGLVIVCDSVNRSICAFSVPGGGFVRCLVNFRDQVENDRILPHGIATNGVGQMFIILRAYGLAEVAIYNI